MFTKDNFLNILNQYVDDNYKKFNSTICNTTKYEMIGIRIPILKQLSKELFKSVPYQEILSIEPSTFEEVMVQGQIISMIKDEDIFYKYFVEYIKYIDNWSLCDTFCPSIRPHIKKNPNKYYKLAMKYSKSNKEYTARVGLILIFGNFIKEEYINEIFNLLDSITNDQYYVNMAEAWLLCEMYIKYPKETLEYLKNNNLNRFTHNKALSKIHDSYRVDKDTKEYLNTLRK